MKAPANLTGTAGNYATAVRQCRGSVTAVGASLLPCSFGNLNQAALVRDAGEGVAADGTIMTGVGRSLVPERFEPALSTAVAAIAEAASDAPSVYVYGSVATGRARHAQSDVDLLTVGLPAGRAAELGRELSKQFNGLCRGIEIAAMMSGDLAGETDEAYGNRVFLRHYCVHLAGQDHARGLARFPADARAARGFNGDIALHAARWRDALAAGDEVQQLGRRLARKSLLAVAGLVSVHDATWTTDRALAADRWADIDPELRAALPELLAWTDGQALPDRHDVRRMLDVATARIVAAFAETIGLWPLADKSITRNEDALYTPKELASLTLMMSPAKAFAAGHVNHVELISDAGRDEFNGGVYSNTPGLPVIVADTAAQHKQAGARAVRPASADGGTTRPAEPIPVALRRVPDDHSRRQPGR